MISATLTSHQVFSHVWANLSTKASIPHLAGIAATTAVVATLLVCSRLWRGPVRQTVVWCHEWGHVVATLLLRGKVSGMRLNFETSGATYTRMRGSRLVRQRQALVSFSGEPAPAIVGLILVALVSAGYAYLGLVVLTAFVVATVVLIRNWWGLLFVVATTAALAATTWWATPSQAAWPVLFIGSLWLVGDLRDIGVAVTNRHMAAHQFLVSPSDDAKSDSANAAQGLHVPRSVIEAAWVLIWVACMAGAVLAVYNLPH